MYSISLTYLNFAQSSGILMPEKKDEASSYQS